MASSERKIGFSTGAIAKGEFHKALDALRSMRIRVVELSALRERELPELALSIPSLDLSPFDYVSVHAPSRLGESSEAEVASLLQVVKLKQLPIILHPDIINDYKIWKQFGPLLLIENLDKRKPTGRDKDELQGIFSLLPEAGLCFDIAHARQVDPTMAEATRILRSFSDRLRQIHASGLNANSTHGPISGAASFAFSQISHLIPVHIPIILESPVTAEHISEEISFAYDAFAPWVQRLRSEIDDVFYFRTPSLRRTQLESFLRALALTGTKLSEFEEVIRQLPSGGPYKRGDIFLSSADLWSRLSESEKIDLHRYFRDRIDLVEANFPDLREQFKEQFS